LLYAAWASTSAQILHLAVRMSAHATLLYATIRLVEEAA